VWRLGKIRDAGMDDFAGEAALDELIRGSSIKRMNFRGFSGMNSVILELVLKSLQR
jgi:hypothetical protein